MLFREQRPWFSLEVKGRSSLKCVFYFLDGCVSPSASNETARCFQQDILRVLLWEVLVSALVKVTFALL